MGWGSSFGGSWSNPIKKVTQGITSGLQKGTDLINDGGSLLNKPLNAAGKVGLDAGNIVGDVGGGLGDTVGGVAGTILTGGLDVIQEGVEGSAGFIKKYGDKVAQLGKEAWSGKGGYGDDAGPDEVRGPTGGVFSDAMATGLTGMRTAKRGGLAHRSKGTASKVNR